MPRYRYSDDKAMFPVNVKSGSGLAGSAAGAAVCASSAAGAANKTAAQNDLRILFMGTTLSIRRRQVADNPCDGTATCMPRGKCRIAVRHGTEKSYFLIGLVREHRFGSQQAGKRNEPLRSPLVSPPV